MNNFYITSFKTFFKIGMFTLGGGYAMIPIIEAEVVDQYKWIDREQFIDIVAVAQSCPGVMAGNMSTFIGYKMRGTRGALCTTLATALPSFFIILAIAIFFRQFQDNPVVESILSLPPPSRWLRAHTSRSPTAGYPLPVLCLSICCT